MYKEFTSIFHEESIVYEDNSDVKRYYAERRAQEHRSHYHGSIKSSGNDDVNYGRDHSLRGEASKEFQSAYNKRAIFDKANDEATKTAKKNDEKARIHRNNKPNSNDRKADKKSAKHESGLLDITLI